jgi:hypothetical protein
VWDSGAASTFGKPLWAALKASFAGAHADGPRAVAHEGAGASWLRGWVEGLLGRRPVRAYA